MNKPFFSKPTKSVQELVDQWEQRGLIIEDRERTSRYLSYINYYRFSVYTIPFQIKGDSGHRFNEGVTFDQVLETYVFDRELRLLAFDALERVEVAIKSQLCNVMCDETQDPFWLYEKRNFKDQKLYAHFMSRLDNELESAQKAKYFCHKTPIQHYYSVYQGDYPPVWMVFEILSFGQICRIYNNLTDIKVKKKIAKNFKLPFPLLSSWMLSLSNVRNIIAHHSRLWNRVFGTSLAKPKSKHVKWIENHRGYSSLEIMRRVYGVLCVLQYFLYTVSPHSGWAMRLHHLLEKYPNVSRKAMRIPENWYSDPFWASAFIEEK